MKQKELELKILELEKEIIELKNRQPITISFPQNYPCPLQHYPSYPVYPQQFPPTPYPYWFNMPISAGTWVGDIPVNYTCLNA